MRLQAKHMVTSALFLNQIITVAAGYKCLQCDDLPLPNLCHEVGECRPNEVCAIEQYFTTTGGFRYRQRCLDKQKCGTAQSSTGNRTLTCAECCHGDLCNADGCGQKGFDTSLGPFCYVCLIQIGTGGCNKIQQCGRDQDCSIYPVSRISAPNELFETRCTERHVCATVNGINSAAIVGRKRSMCSVCCNSSLCNDYDSRPCLDNTNTKFSTVSTKSVVNSGATPVSTEFTTAPAATEVCEDSANAVCHKAVCYVSTPYMEKNCRETCQLCKSPTTGNLDTTTGNVTPARRTQSSAPFKTSTSTGLVRKSRTILVISLYQLLHVVSSYKCLQCDSVPLPNLCEEVGECGAHEPQELIQATVLTCSQQLASNIFVNHIDLSKGRAWLCAVEQYVTAAGSFRFRQTCMDKLQCKSVQSGLGKRNDFSTCSECCHGDLCNAAGCGEQGFDLAFGPVCYACSLQIGTGTCSMIQQCGRDKECSIHPVSRLGAPDNLFETKCIERNMCVARDDVDASSIVGRKRSTCSVCCNTTLCNDYDSRPCVPSSTTTSVTTASTVATSAVTRLTSLRSEQTSTQQTVTTQKTVTSTGFTTAPVTLEVCDDTTDAKCHAGACIILTPYVEKNCRKTCNLCAGKTTPGIPSTTTARKSTVTSTPLRTSVISATSNSVVSGHTHDPFCRDLVAGCDHVNFFCQLDEYKEWSKSNCRLTCNYC